MTANGTESKPLSVPHRRERPLDDCPTHGSVQSAAAPHQHRIAGLKGDTGRLALAGCTYRAVRQYRGVRQDQLAYSTRRGRAEGRSCRPEYGALCSIFKYHEIEEVDILRLTKAAMSFTNGLAILPINSRSISATTREKPCRIKFSA